MELLTKGEYAYRRLQEDILSGKLPSDSRLVVKDLAEEYQISSMPIRNAITRLEELGYVRTSAHQGAWVTEMNLNNYFTFMLLRIEAEALAAMFAAWNRNETLLAELEDVYRRMEMARDTTDYETYGRMNRKSHTLVCEASGNSALVEYINLLMNRTQLAVSFFSVVPDAAQASCREHRDWIDALRSRDARRSAAILRHQRCRSNLGLIHAIQSGSSIIEGNHFITQAAKGEEGRRSMETFSPIFEDILRQNDYIKNGE